MSRDLSLYARIVFSGVVVLSLTGCNPRESQIAALCGNSDPKQKIEASTALSSSLDFEAIERVQACSGISEGSSELDPVITGAMAKFEGSTERGDVGVREQIGVAKTLVATKSPSVADELCRVYDSGDNVVKEIVRPYFSAYRLEDWVSLHEKASSGLSSAELTRLARDMSTEDLLSVYRQTPLEVLKSILVTRTASLDNWVSQIGEDSVTDSLLAGMGESAFEKVRERLRDRDQKARFGAGDILVEMRKEQPQLFLKFDQSLAEEDLGEIARNYIFYIRLGANGSEDVLVRALDANFSERMSLDYLNCGHEPIEAAAKSVAERHGYRVYTEEGTHGGPRWGSGN